MYYTPHGQQTRDSLPEVLVYSGAIIRNPTRRQCLDAGWREVIPDSAQVPDGYRISGRTYTEVDREFVLETLVFDLIPAPVDPLSEYLSEISAFQAAWFGAGMREIPEDWSAAITMLERAEVDDRTLIRLLALRMALNPVWSLILAGASA